MTVRCWRLILPVLALTLAARRPHAEPAEPRAAAPSAVDNWAAPTAFFRRTNCGTCQLLGCGHTLPLGGSEDYANPHSDCLAIPDCDGHPTCSVAYLPEPDQRRFVELVEQAVNGSMESVELLLRDFGQVAELNEERESLQIRGCDPDSYMANIPLTPFEFASASQYAAGAAAKN